MYNNTHDQNSIGSSCTNIMNIFTCMNWLVYVNYCFSQKLRGLWINRVYELLEIILSTHPVVLRSMNSPVNSRICKTSQAERRKRQRDRKRWRQLSWLAFHYPQSVSLPPITAKVMISPQCAVLFHSHYCPNSWILFSNRTYLCAFSISHFHRCSSAAVFALQEPDKASNQSPLWQYH